ncbi:hypothetical protein QMA79_18225 [Pseudomonas aeruginosa]|uniref:hypothetical protein n=1 Tax=Pseudomonas aeruginosa TaxID=287 RepID=UPI0024ACF827|nr:hypothetical protein [Pseudomonas aeruginosa]MDI6671750.1 hypothetical protein [Pseudomonas aeruginosa]HCJ7406048.1 hypothetical protein [Pseudomonas aeruginosa]
MISTIPPKSQLEELIGDSQNLTVGRREFAVSNIRREGDLGLFATFKTKRAEFIAMNIPARVIGRPNAEAWSVLSFRNRGSKIVDFAIDQGRVLVLV